MKKQLLSLLFAGATLTAMAQSFTVSGPRTIYDLNTVNKEKGRYTFFSFDKAKEISSSDSATTKWDIAFGGASGTTILLNGGTSGPGTVTGQVLTATSFLTQTEAPAADYVADTKSVKAIKTGTGNGWYKYYASADYMSGPHSIKPIADRIIAIKLADGRYVKLEILNYYQGAPDDVPTDVTAPEYDGIAGYFSFRYLIADEGSTDWSQKFTKVTNLNIGLSNKTVTNYFNLASADTILTSESSTAVWDLGFLAQNLSFNSEVTAQVVEENINDVNTAPESGYAVTTLGDGAWNQYMGAPTHLVNVFSDKTIVVKTAKGKYAKVKMESYYQDGDTKKPRFLTFSYYFQPYNSKDLKTTETATSINKVKAANSFSMYPNPISSAKQNIIFKLEDSNNTSVSIYDMQGVKVYSSVLVNNEVNGLNLNQGIYMVTLEANGKISQQRLVVQ